MPDSTLLDLDAIRERLADVPEPASIGFASARAGAGLHQSLADSAALLAEVDRLRAQLAAVRKAVEVRADTARMYARLSEKGHDSTTYLVNRGKATAAAGLRDEVLKLLGEPDGGA